jgi:hypothetical protein
MRNKREKTRKPLGLRLLMVAGTCDESVMKITTKKNPFTAWTKLKPV